MAAQGEQSQNGRDTDRVRFHEGDGSGPIAYCHNEVISSGDERALEAARQIAPDAAIAETLGPFVRIVGMPDPVAMVRHLRAAGFQAQPNHVHFHHALTAGDVEANPVYGNPVYGNPVYGNPVYGNPVYGNPVYGSPVYGNPVTGNPHQGRGNRWSTARPVAPGKDTKEVADQLRSTAVAGNPQIFVLDTGLAGPDYRPTALHDTVVTAVSAADDETPDANADGFLEPAAGHGTFIAGIIGRLAPGCPIEVHRVLSGFGEGHEWEIAKCIYALLPRCNDRTIVSISFGAYTMEGAHVMEWAVGELRAKKAVVVASAGNDATCRPMYPAALGGVVGVGAVGPFGPAPFTNYGPWINLCAPGVDLLSTFFDHFDGRVPVGPDGVQRTDTFRGWARWSGTSFAAPVVVGNVARLMLLGAPTAHAAVERLANSSSGMNIPNLGRIINFV